MISLTDRKALVTGGAQGIGANICIALAKAGANVAIIDHQIDKMNRVVDQSSGMKGQVLPIAADLSSDVACRNAVNEASRLLGGLDIVVNNAAPSRDRTKIGAMTDADWTLHEQIVLSAAVSVVDAAQEFLTDSENASVVNISSVVSRTVTIDYCSWPYHVSKAGLEQLTRWLAVKYGPVGIRANAIAPGLIDREERTVSEPDAMRGTIVDTIIPLGRSGTATDVSNAVLFLCSEYSSYVTGQVLVVDGGTSLLEVYGAAARIYGALQ